MKLAEIALVHNDNSTALQQLRKCLQIAFEKSPTHLESTCFSYLADLKPPTADGRALLRLRLTAYTIERQIGHADAKEKFWPQIVMDALALDLDEFGLGDLVTEVEAAYAVDRGRGLIAAVFPELKGGAGTAESE